MATTLNDVSYIAGTEGYILEISNNPLINEDNVNTILSVLKTKYEDMRFRKLSGKVRSDFRLESMDPLCVEDYKGNAYDCYLTRLTYTIGDYTDISCDCKTKEETEISGNSTVTKILKMAESSADKKVEQEKNVREKALAELTEKLSKNTGLYYTAQEAEGGGYIYYTHDKKTLAESTFITKWTAEAIGISMDGGKTYPYGFTVTAKVIMDIIAANKVSATYIEGGILKLGGQDNTHGAINILNAKGELIGSWGANGVDAQKGFIGGWSIENGMLKRTTEAYIPPNKKVLDTLSYVIRADAANTLDKNLYDFNGNGQIDMYDFVYVKRVLNGLTEFNKDTCAIAKTSTVTITINPYSTKEMISIYGTDMWGQERKTIMGIQYSAYKTEGECEAWMVTPEMTVGADDKLSFDVCVGNWNADCLTVWISEDFDGKDVKKATWTDITSHFTIPSAPAKGYGSFASAGTFPLAQYGGKKVFVAFKYLGDGVNKKTTTYQIDNVMIGSKIPEGEGLKADVAFDLKVFDGKKWNNADKNVLVLSVEDYKEMGQNQYCFSEKVPAADYLPNYLAKVIAYPVDQENRVVVYRYNNGKEVKNYSDEYTYSAATGRWTLNTRIVDLTQQYVFAGGVWKFDPSMTITLEAVKGNAESAAFYQAIVDYVGKTFGSDYYQTPYTNAEFYYGASSYQNNFSFYPYSWRESNKAGAAAYQHLSDEELTALMFERLPEAVRIGLEAIYSDADVVTGVEVTYTVNFSIYGINGTKDTTVYTVKYVVTGKAEFEYVEDSLKAVG